MRPTADLSSFTDLEKSETTAIVSEHLHCEKKCAVLGYESSYRRRMSEEGEKGQDKGDSKETSPLIFRCLSKLCTRETKGRESVSARYDN